METLGKSIEVSVPVRTAYDQWTQFEEFPKFMEGVEAVEQLDDAHLRWRAKIAGKEVEWTAEIFEQKPDTRIAWRSTSGVKQTGIVTFDKISAGKTKVTLSLQYEPRDWVESLGGKLGLLSARIGGDLERFKKFIESRGIETGAWRGEVDQAHPHQ